MSARKAHVDYKVRANHFELLMSTQAKVLNIISIGLAEQIIDPFDAADAIQAVALSLERDTTPNVHPLDEAA